MFRLPEARPATLAKTAAIAFAAVLLFTTGGLYYNYRIEPTSPPKDVKITNLTDSGVSISWTTEKQTRGIVYFAEREGRLWSNPLAPYLGARLAFDDHGVYSRLHHVTLQNLDPEKDYKFFISTGLHVYTRSLPDFKTLASEESPRVPFPAYGQVSARDGFNPAFPVIIYLSHEDMLPASTVTNREGGWSFDLASLRSTDGSPVSFSVEGDVFVFDAVGGEHGSRSTILSTLEAQPAAEVTLE